ncbi:MAG: hypothetical protein JOZ33_13380, partial [Acidobacteriaceae bacterium]|nr:hypothetical protein [Acidobacteriaceae bacterium]
MSIEEGGLLPSSGTISGAGFFTGVLTGAAAEFKLRLAAVGRPPGSGPSTITVVLCTPLVGPIPAPETDADADADGLLALLVAPAPVPLSVEAPAAALGLGDVAVKPVLLEPVAGLLNPVNAVPATAPSTGVAVEGLGLGSGAFSPVALPPGDIPLTAGLLPGAAVVLAVPVSADKGVTDAADVFLIS